MITAGRRAATKTKIPLSKISAVLGSGVVTTAALIVMVSTKKSHPFTPAFGVVIVTEVIGDVMLEVREKLPNPLTELSAGMLVNTCEATSDGPENASTS